jgi:hypothetical protein
LSTGNALERVDGRVKIAYILRTPGKWPSPMVKL